MTPIFVWEPMWLHIVLFVATLLAGVVVSYFLGEGDDGESLAVLGIWTILTLPAWFVVWGLVGLIAVGAGLYYGAIGLFRLLDRGGEAVEAKLELRNQIRREEEAEERKQAELRRQIEQEINDSLKARNLL